MKLGWRVALALAGLAVVLISALLLAYAFWPTGTRVEQFQPPATLFAPPQSLTLTVETA